MNDDVPNNLEWSCLKIGSDTTTTIHQPSVSVVIRNRNESEYLRHVLRAVSIQNVRSIEVIVVDNESTDDSIDVARSFGARVVTIADAAFTYGRALNLGLREARAEICVILSAHSLPLGIEFLSECMKPFSDKAVAAARCVYAGKGADLTRWMIPEFLDDTSDYISKGPLASGCAIRRSVWEEVPFDEDVEAAEEKLWAAEILSRGYKIHSPCSAFYFYLKALPAGANLRKNYREIKQVYLSTGLRVGFVNRSIAGTMIDLARGLVVKVPSGAFAGARYELQKAYLRMAFARQARRNVAKPK